MHVTRLVLHDFRSYGAVEIDLEPGADGVHRRQRTGQDQPGRGDRLPLHGSTRTGSRPTPPRARRRRAGDRARARCSVRTARHCWSWRSRPARPIAPASTAPPCPACATSSASLRTVHVLARGPRPGEGRPVRPAAASSTSCSSCARRGWRGSRPTTTACSSSATPCSSRRGPAQQRRDLHARHLGREPAPHRGPSWSPRASRCSTTSPRTLADAYRDVAADAAADRREVRATYKPSVDCPPTRAARSDGDRARPCWTRSAAAAATSSSAASASSARTATRWC